MSKKIVIIGSGVAGLSAGIYARMNGFEAQIVEMGHTVGGVCTSWYRSGYKFDYSIQWLVGTRYGAFHD
ncbi:MAG: NAD(P)/FAD-dependent oxidoreductase, partial [Tannerella sp.]|nr:NAD(P)/FAD-dependent oxidoreductase [Tannerella sp.]